MIRTSKLADERREAGTIECCCLHGAVGLAADWRPLTQALAEARIGSRAVDLWRFLECEPMPLDRFGAAFNADAGGSVERGPRILIGYSMGGRLALHALLQPDHPWKAAVIIGAHPGIEDESERSKRAATDAQWASHALMGSWSDFLHDWEQQAILQGTAPRDAHDSARLQLRRREIARSFVDWSLGNQTPLWERLPEIGIPVLWVVGEHDEKFRALGERACAGIPHATLAIAPGAGHRVPWQAGEWLAETIRRFLNQGA